MIGYKNFLDDLLGVEPQLTEEVKETIEEVKKTEKEKIEECIPSFVEKVPLPVIKHEIDIKISNAVGKEKFCIYFYDKREEKAESVFIYVYKNAIDNFKKGLIVTLQTYEKWCEFVKINGCTNGYDKELWCDTKSNLSIGVKYEDASPKFYFFNKPKYIFERNNIIYFNSVDEALVYCTEMFEKIGLFVVQDEKEKQQNEKNDDFLDEYQKLLKATQNGLL